MMSGSEPGIMSGRESFAVGIQKNQVHTQQSATPNMRLAFSSDGTAVYKPVISAGSPPYAPAATVSVGGSGGGGDSSNNTNSPGAMVPHGISMSMVGEPMKRKRGRPRKYGPDGTMALALTPSSQGVPTSAGGGSGGNGGGGFSPSSGGPVSPSSSMKKSRGRPPGSGKKQQIAALGSVGVGFTPHVISVQAGEDVSSKIMSFSQHGPRAVCILSANGAISNVTLRQAATSGGTVTYEGRFEILSLSGSYLLSEDAGQGRSRTGGLSVSLAGPDGRVLGGGVAGLLTAATPVQVVVGSFIADGRKETKITNHQSEPSSTTPKLPPGGAGGMGTGSPPSRGTLSESSGGPGSPLNQSTGACNNSNNPQGMANMPWK